MSTKITTCDECESRNITTLNPELRDAAKASVVALKARCEDCGHEFEYPSATLRGKRSKIRY